MVNYLIVSHGTLADGFKSTLSILMGKEQVNNIKTICAFLDGDTSNPKDQINDVCKSIKDDDQLVIFTDVMYGSVNQFVVPYVQQGNVFVITGANFPLILEIVTKYSFSENLRVSEDELREIMANAKEQIIYVNDSVKQNLTKQDNDEEFFK